MASVNTTWQQADEVDAILYPYILAITFTQLSVSSLGLLFNGALVYVTIRNKQLQSSLGLLLAIASFCDAMVETSIFPTLVFVLMRKRISLLNCAYFQLYSTGCASNSYLMLFFISLDRLYALAFPISYKKHLKMGAVKYVALLNCFSLAYILFGHFLAVRNAIWHPEMMVYCEPGDIYAGDAALLSYRVMLVVTLAAVFNYVIMGIMLHAYKNSNSNNGDDSQRETTRHIFKSLAVIMSIIFLSYPLYGLSKGILFAFIKDPIWLYLLTRNQMVPIAQAINAPVLFACSTQYRSIFKKQFKLLGHFFPQSPTVHVHLPPSTMVFAANSHARQN